MSEAVGSDGHSEENRDTADRTAPQGGADKGFLDGNWEVDFTPLHRDDAYGFLRRTRLRLDYDAVGRAPRSRA